MEESEKYENLSLTFFILFFVFLILSKISCGSQELSCVANTLKKVNFVKKRPPNNYFISQVRSTYAHQRTSLKPLFQYLPSS